MTIEEKSRTIATEKTIAFATNMQLDEAIEKIHEYETAYNDHFLLAVNFSLLQVSKIADLSKDQLEMARVELVEELDHDDRKGRL